MTPVSILTAQTTTGSVPTLSTDGVELNKIGKPDQALCLVKVTGTGAVSATLDVYAYEPTLDAWFRLGQFNGGAVSGTTTATAPDVVQNLHAFQRLALVITAISGTGATVNAVMCRAE
jgi:hypothetical protein